MVPEIRPGAQNDFGGLTADRPIIRIVALVVAITTALWVAMVAYLGTRAFSFFHVGLSSCLPSDFPSYPRASIASIVISDTAGNCTIQYRTRDSADEVQAFYETHLDEDDWTVTSVDLDHRFVRFQRVSRPETTGYVEVLSFGGLTQFQIQIRAG